MRGDTRNIHEKKIRLRQGHSFDVDLSISREIFIFGVSEGRAGFEEDHTAYVEGRRGHVNVKHAFAVRLQEIKCGGFTGLRPDLDTKMTTQNTKSRADAQWSTIQVARRIGFREQYYTGMKKFYSAGKVAGRNVEKL